MTKTGKWLMMAFIVVVLYPHETKAATYTATSCSASDVQTAIRKTSNGDTVLIPGGNCTWATVVTITDAITLNGQGTTTITWDPTHSGHLNVTAVAAASTFVTGINFVGEYPNGGCPINLATSFSPQSSTFRFHDNTLNWIGGSYYGTMLCVSGTGPGLIDHNTFTTDHGADEIIHNLGQGPGDSSGWTTDVVPGSSNMLFIEANTFNYEATTSAANASGPPYYFWGTSVVQSYYGARTVVRYNNITMMQVDIHGSCSAIYGRWWEIYKNTFTVVPSANQSNYAAIRGGSGVAWGNTVSNPSSNLVPGVIQLQEDCTSGSYPIPDQVGRGINQSLSPAYIWSNLTGMSINNTNTAYIQPGREYYTSSSQPTTLERCQSAADITTGCPVSYNYTPYIYPHPLDTNVQTPAPPTNVSIVLE